MNILSIIKETKRKDPDCLKPVNNSSCSSLVLTSNGVDEIDFQDIWNILFSFQSDLAEVAVT